MNYVRSKSLSLKKLGFPQSGCQVIGIRKFEFVGKTQIDLRIFGADKMKEISDLNSFQARKTTISSTY